MNDDSKKHKAGFICIIGKPNVGKSTLLNQLLTRKIAPVSRKPQTTREVIHGILSDQDSQMVFVDTPGLHRPKDNLGRLMVRAAKNTFVEADLIYVMVSASAPGREEAEVFEEIQGLKIPVFLLINKVDKLKDKREVLPLIEQYQPLYDFKEIIPISALRNKQLEALVSRTKEYLPEAPAYYPSDMTCNRPVEEIAKELIREKIVRMMGDEIPYVTAVKIEKYHIRENGLADLEATIIVDRESQKGILIGKRGSMLKEIGQEARKDLENFLDRKVFLKLWVKVLKGWKNDFERLRMLGYES